MTTQVTIDTRAGHAVLLSATLGEPGGDKTLMTKVVDPGLVHTIYIHSGMRITGIEELPHDKS